MNFTDHSHTSPRNKPTNSDGQDGTTRADSADVREIARLGMLTCVGIGHDHDARLLSALAQRGHGSFAFASTADEVCACVRVLSLQTYMFFGGW